MSPPQHLDPDALSSFVVSLALRSVDHKMQMWASYELAWLCWH